jgi:glycine dehydrogenase subunit 1
MSYISLSDEDKRRMLERIGVSSVDDLFCCIPDEIRLDKGLDIPGPYSELELMRRFDEFAESVNDREYLTFLGGGAYRHAIPAAVDYLSMRGEFISPYTPYQPEVSQGTLQIIFEFQTLICQLTGMDIANASLYDGASGSAEAVLMASRLTRRPKILVAASLNPQYRRVIETYTRNLDAEVVEVGFAPSGGLDMEALEAALDDQTAAVILQSPNYFGVIEDLKAVGEAAHGKKALMAVVVSEALSLGLLKSPGELGADIVTGEGQSFGLPLSFGGPYLGFMACSKDYVRQFPGRIAGETRDIEGKRGFVLTLSTREQHIRRERATSNICTNQAWCALRATIFLSLLGKQGLREMAWQNVQKAGYAKEKLTMLKGIKLRFTGETFNEFVCEFDKPWQAIHDHLKTKKILAGIGLIKDYPQLRHCALINVTELHTKEKIDRLVDAFREIL